MFISSVLLIYLSYPLGLSILDGFVMLFLFIIYLFYLLRYYSGYEKNYLTNIVLSPFSLMLLILGFLLIGFGSDLFIKGTINISKTLGFANNIAISMSVVAFGTSLPELITSLVAIVKKEADFAIGNIIGSNIINILFAASFASIVNPIYINFTLIKSHLFILFIVTLLLIIMVYTFRKLDRVIGIIFIFIYFIFLYITFF